MACDHELVLQEGGDLVCTVSDCPDVAHCDLVTSCCLAEPAPDGTCSMCGTPINDGVALTEAETAALRLVGAILAGDAREVEPSEPAHAWNGLVELLRRLGVEVPQAS